MVISVGTGNDPTPVSIDSPDPGYTTVSNDGDFYVPKGSDEGKQAFDACKNAQCW